MSDSNVKFMKRSMVKASLNVLSFFQPEDTLKLYLNVNESQPIYVYIDICLYIIVFINKKIKSVTHFMPLVSSVFGGYRERPSFVIINPLMHNVPKWSNTL